MNTTDRVIDILKELSGKATIQENDKLLDDIGLDSLGMVTLLVEIEDTFLIELDESDLNPFDLSCVSDVIKLIEKYSEVEHEKKR